MPHQIDPEDLPIDHKHPFNPTKTLFLKGVIHFKHTAQVVDVSDEQPPPSSRKNPLFGGSFIPNATGAAESRLENEDYEYDIASCGDMMRTIKTVKDARSGDKICDLNMSIVACGSSEVRFPPGSEHSRRMIEMFDVYPNEKDIRHEAFIHHSVPYFWNLDEKGTEARLYKSMGGSRALIGKAVAHGFNRDVILVMDGDEVDDVVAFSTCIIFLNGRDAMDS